MPFNPTVDIDALRAGNRRALARAITLVESQNPAHRPAANALLDSLMPYTGTSTRLGISGVPGVGKSTFIETFGLRAIERGQRVAVLAVDPSSPVNGGSILGDKTRMESLSRADGAFIRPSPAGDSLGGVAQRTREAILLCEAAGYDQVWVETVGVGQSEHAVANMTDAFMVLMQPGAGDELQGIKKGILELADFIVVNKADGDATLLAEASRRHYQNAVNLLTHNGFWQPQVLSISAVTFNGLDTLEGQLQDYLRLGSKSLAARRTGQNLSWLEEQLRTLAWQAITQDPDAVTRYQRAREAVMNGTMAPIPAAMSVLQP
ncbi:methylmalonyl Co-A mutase-associated GTPase MeaB [Litorivicinus lipolyticus]|uniref:methylmalonyl Co-A mutase-associated GTPase MeaB n=1 Tax=Litorivicinus lipolyticus TaxID=418701 RepID=UPI003B5CF4B3